MDLASYRFVCLLCFLVVMLPQRTYAQQGLHAEYFNDIELKEHVLTRTEARPYLNYYLQTPAPGVKQEYFSVRWSGKMTAPASGEYTFSVRSDDGVRVWINDQKIIDAWWDQEAANHSGSIYLQKNKQYAIKIEYYNSILHSVFMLSWENPLDAYTFMGYSFYKPKSDVPAHIFSLDAVQQNVKPKNTEVPVTAKVITQPVSNKPIENKPVKKPKPETEIAINEPIELKSVHFEQTKYELLEDSHDELNTIIDYLKKHPHLKIKIIGHTDYAGDSTANYILSEQRANAVAGYFKTNGIDSHRVVVVAKGSSQPRIIHNKTQERRQNRRVEFVLFEQ